MANICIKKGLYSNIGNLQDGDLGFAKYDNNNGTFIIKDGNTAFYTLPKPGTLGSFLIGRGLNAAPSYTTGHFINDTKIAVNSTKTPAENFYVNGKSKFYGSIETISGITINTTTGAQWPGKITVKKNGRQLVQDFFYTGATSTNKELISIIKEVKRISHPTAYDEANTQYYYTDISFPQAIKEDGYGQCTLLSYENDKTPISNRLLYSEKVSNSANTASNIYIRSSGHYIDLTRLGINIDSIPSTDTTSKLYVNGNSTFTGAILPQTDLAQNIGSLDKSFNAIYAKALYLKGANSKTNRIIGNNPTDNNYYAKLPNYSGNITISINNHYNVGGDGITCFIPFYSTKGEVIQYNNGLQYYTLEGTTTKEGYGMLILGNSTSSGSAGNKRGTLRLYGPNNMYTNVMATTLTKNRRAYIRDYGIDETYFVGVDSNAGKGSETTPIYIADTGLATACSSYAGGTAVTLNGTSKAANTASFYAPTSAGNSGYILKSNGTGAPSWIQSVPIANGGTGATSITVNRLLYVTSSKITASSHYISSTKVGINYTSAPSENLYVSGSAKITGDTTLGDAQADKITINGKTILKSDVTYGTDNPEDIYTTTTAGAATTPVEGQIYFKIIS